MATVSGGHSARCLGWTIVVAAALCGTALADDAVATKPQMPAPSNRQLMRECMAELKRTSEDVADDALRKACKEQLRAHRQHPHSDKPVDAPLPSVVPPT